MKDIVSIIIPAFNVENYISRAIESSLQQTYSDIEVIIVDDGSADNTLQIANKYAVKDCRVKVRSKDNGGVSSARNIGLQVASGSKLIFLDSDDWLELNAIQHLVSLSKHNKDLLICCDRYWVSESEDNKTTKVYPAKRIPTKTVAIKDALMCIGSGKYNLQSACYKLFDRSIIEKHSLRFQETIHYGEDGLFVYEYLKLTKGLVYTSEPLWDIYERTGSATKSGYNKKMLTALDMVDILLNETEDDEVKNIIYKYGIGRCQELVVSISIGASKEFSEDLSFTRSKMKYYSTNANLNMLDRLKTMYYYKAPNRLLACTSCSISMIKKPIKRILYAIRT